MQFYTSHIIQHSHPSVPTLENYDDIGMLYFTFWFRAENIAAQLLTSAVLDSAVGLLSADQQSQSRRHHICLHLVAVSSAELLPNNCQHEEHPLVVYQTSNVDL